MTTIHFIEKKNNHFFTFFQVETAVKLYNMFL